MRLGTKVLCLAAAAFATFASVSAGQDPLEFAKLKDFKAERSSSSSPDPNSNNDSKHPIAGETVTLADLEGPGVVTHLWITVAANEYGWPRLMRLRVYYDGSAEASVDAPLGDGFLMADLLFERGMTTFDAARAHAWIEERLGDPPASVTSGRA